MFLPDRQSLEFFPDYRSTQVAWQGLVPFGAWAIRAARPRRVVELGSYRGDSFFTFQQAAHDVPEVEELWAIDSWAGDIHTGPYGEDVFLQFQTEFARRNDPRAHYLRMTFDEALSQFEDGSISLLHIDGAHDYDSVRRDYQSWLPKMEPDGLILFHDTEVRTDDFGVYRLWAEIAADAPGRCRNLPFSNGLGVLSLGTGQSQNAIQTFCALSDSEGSLAEHALKIAGDRIVALSRYEYGLLQRTGSGVPEGHVFARGSDVDSLRGLWQAEVSLRDIPAGGLAAEAVTALVEKRAGDLTATVEENIAYALRRVRSDVIETLSARIAESVGALRQSQTIHLEERLEEVTGVIDRRQADLQASFDAALAKGLSDITALVNDTVDTLLKERGAEIHAAIAQRIQQDIERRLKSGLKAFEKSYDTRVTQLIVDILPQCEAQIEPMIRRAIKMKNDAQDDAIIGIGAKVQAQEQAIQSLSKYLGDVLRHPIFAG